MVPSLWAMCAARLRERAHRCNQAPVAMQEFVIHDADSAAEHDWGGEFQANWQAAPPTPQFFDMADDSDHGAMTDGELENPEMDEAFGSDGEQERGVQVEASASEAIPYADLEALVELSSVGEAVRCPAGWTEHSAKAALIERPAEASAKRSRIELQPEAERNGGSTPFIPRPKAVPIVKTVRANGN